MCTRCISHYGVNDAEALSSEQSSCEICKPIYEHEAEKYDRENFIRCHKCEYVVPLEAEEKHWFSISI